MSQLKLLLPTRRPIDLVSSSAILYAIWFDRFVDFLRPSNQTAPFWYSTKRRGFLVLRGLCASRFVIELMKRARWDCRIVVERSQSVDLSMFCLDAARHQSYQRLGGERVRKRSDGMITLNKRKRKCLFRKREERLRKKNDYAPNKRESNHSLPLERDSTNDTQHSGDQSTCDPNLSSSRSSTTRRTRTRSHRRTPSSTHRIGRWRSRHGRTCRSRRWDRCGRGSGSGICGYTILSSERQGGGLERVTGGIVVGFVRVQAAERKMEISEEVCEGREREINVQDGSEVTFCCVVTDIREAVGWWEVSMRGVRRDQERGNWLVNSWIVRNVESSDRPCLFSSSTVNVQTASQSVPFVQEW